MSTGPLKLNGGFWTKLGPIILSLLTGVALTAGTASLKTGATNRADIGRLEERLSSASRDLAKIERHDAAIEERLRTLEAFARIGDRYTSGDGDKLKHRVNDLGRISEALANACAETDPELKRRLLRSRLAELREWRADD